MTFQLAEGPVKVWWPVEVEVPTDGGKTIKHKFSAQFEILGLEEFEEMTDEAEDEVSRNLRRLEQITQQITAGTQGGKPADPVRSVLLRVTHDWKEIVDEENKPIEFSHEKLAAALNVPFVRKAVYGAYLACQTGRRLKN